MLHTELYDVILSRLDICGMKVDSPFSSQVFIASHTQENLQH
jgi:hypothetical protein